MCTQAHFPNSINVVNQYSHQIYQTPCYSIYLYCIQGNRLFLLIIYKQNYYWFVENNQYDDKTLYTI